MIARIRAILYFGSLFGLILTLGPFVLAIGLLFRKPGWIRSVCRWFSSGLFRLFGIHVEIRGLERLRPGQSYLFVSNHQSFLDIQVFMGWLRFPAFLAKKEIESWPLFGPAMRMLDCVFVDRAKRGSHIEVAAAIREKVSKGVDFCIYPEGTRSFDGKLLPFKSGSFHIALDAGCQVMPTTIHASGRVLNKRGYRLYPGTITVVLGEPIDCRALQGSVSPKVISAQVAETIAGELAALDRAH